MFSFISDNNISIILPYVKKHLHLDVLTQPDFIKIGNSKLAQDV